ncbi:hypothetical protein ANN_23647 [Periplaneta americana]|uniref:Uncharacterized protein n=1 Tax=Periplaneta americana TaxID=6978 RepID=A0ABQ8SLP5_PERAM|nr:hypothetical protein ANN_23647 [Periplaneta americana]
MSRCSNSECFAVGGFISYHRFNIKEEITWTKFYCTEIVRGYVSEANVERVRESFTRSPQKSTVKASRELNIPQQTVWKILRKRLKLHPYRLQLLQALKPDDKAKRQSFCEEMQLRMETEDFIESLVISDEATFHLSGKVQKYNVTIWALENPNSYVKHVFDSPKVNVFCAISREKVYGPFFVCRGDSHSVINFNQMQVLGVQFKVCHGSLYVVIWLADEPREFNLPTLPQRRITYALEKLPSKYGVHSEENLPIRTDDNNALSKSATRISYKICHEIAKELKTFNEDEFSKRCLIILAGELCPQQVGKWKPYACLVEPWTDRLDTATCTHTLLSTDVHIRTDHVRYTLRYLHCCSVVSCSHPSDSALNGILRGKVEAVVGGASTFAILRFARKYLLQTIPPYLTVAVASLVILTYLPLRFGERKTQLSRSKERARSLSAVCAAARKLLERMIYCRGVTEGLLVKCSWKHFEVRSSYELMRKFFLGAVLCPTSCKNLGKGWFTINRERKRQRERERK